MESAELEISDIAQASLWKKEQSLISIITSLYQY